MWFKNLQLYRFTKPFELDAETLGRQLAEHSFVPCGSQDATRSGWIPPLGRHGSEFVHATNGYLMLCRKRQDKLLPAAVVNEALEEKVLHIEEREARKLPARQRRSLQDEVIFNLLPRAFARSSLQYAYISPRDNLLVVDAAAASRAEEMIDDLRAVLGSLSVVPLASNKLPIEVMTQWVNSAQPPPGFVLNDECELRDNADIGCVIRCKNQDLAAAEIVSHLKTGMHVSKLALNWQERIEFLLDEKLAIKRLRFSELVQEQADEIEADDVAARFDVDFAIMALELSGFFKALLDAFGGEDLTRREIK
ncbi:MAG: recombination-associated protein RdgC [Gammaproteobacteria bacterium]|nr:recombination-associated protein RdgC [Gammaproteobacteria bacterium]MDH3449165.1 recombination-associated protein RdgC [Gammaproteobacteria bacterium]